MNDLFKPITEKEFMETYKSEIEKYAFALNIGFDSAFDILYDEYLKIMIEYNERIKYNV